MSKGSIGNDLYTGRRSFPFIAKRKYWFAISLALIAISAVTLAVKGLNLGIEFTGGSQFTVSHTKVTDQKPAADIMRTYAKDTAARVVQVGDSTLRIQTAETKLSDDNVRTVRSELAKSYKVSPSNVASTFIGPTWGQDISSKALKGFIAFLVAVALGLTLYFRSWRNAAGAILALFNDLVITIGVYALFGFEVTPSTIIGLLTILGYSLYDTVVVFDKVRENSAKLLSQSDYTFAESVNLAVNQTLIRSLNTSVTSLLAVVSILFIGTYFLGAGTLRDLALVMFVGMILSTLSSMFIASPIAVQLAHLDPKIRQHTEKVEKARGELRERIAERRAAGEEISSEEEED
ncbi:MAG: protein translocase subunit SecF, partial [Peptidiphaga gingivicola]